MVEIGKLIVFNFVHLFANKKTYSIFRSWDLFMLFRSFFLQSMNGMWKRSSLNKNREHKFT